MSAKTRAKAEILFNGTYEQYIQACTAPRVKHARGDSSRKHGDVSFYGSSTFEEAVELCTTGDIKRAKTISSIVIDTANAVRNKLPQYNIEYCSDEGAFIDVAKFVTGEPECLGQFVETNKAPTRALSIAINMSFSCGYSAKSILELGGKFAGLLLGLRASGINATIYIYYTVQPSSWSAKAMTAPESQRIINLTACDTSKLAAAFSPYFFRRLDFSLAELQSEEHQEIYGVGCGYGRSGSLDVAIPVDICINNPMELVNSSCKWNQLTERIERELNNPKGGR